MNFYTNNATGELLTADEARKQWREEYDGDDATNILHFGDQYTPVTGEDAVIADINYTIATHAPNDKYKYMLLDRMKADCEYYLGYGNRCARYLWGLSVGTHIESMLLLYDSFPEEDRPEWLTREEIVGYGQRMNPQEGRK